MRGFGNYIEGKGNAVVGSGNVVGGLSEAEMMEMITSLKHGR